jgi:hypothetical protein
MKASAIASTSRLASLIALSACMSNGTLFDDVQQSSVDDAREPPPVVVTELEEQPPAAPAPADVPSDISERVGEGGLPLAGRVPRPESEAEPAPEPPEPEPPALPEPPAIVSVTPEDGAVGVRSDTSIVIRFSTPMDREITRAAYQSEAVPSDSVTFIWNDESTELTIVPNEPLEYSTGSDPDEVAARRVSFFISASAADSEGRRLEQAFESSFSLLRRIELTALALQDRDLSGSFRSNDSYGAGECGRAQTGMCVGDVRMGLQNLRSKGFISFELPALPDEALEPTAILSLEITSLAGNPFAGLGGLVLEHASFDEIDLDAFSDDALDEMGLIADSGGTGSVVSADVSSAVLTDGLERDITQYRLSFQSATDGDRASDTLVSTWDTQTLEISYLLP